MGLVVLVIHDHRAFEVREDRLGAVFLFDQPPAASYELFIRKQDRTVGSSFQAYPVWDNKREAGLPPDTASRP